VSTDLVARLDRQYKAAQTVADLFTLEMIVARQQLHDTCLQLLESDESDRYTKKCLDVIWKKIYYEVVSAARQMRKVSVSKQRLSTENKVGGLYTSLKLCQS
jgi:hypothetical protein